MFVCVCVCVFPHQPKIVGSLPREAQACFKEALGKSSGRVSRVGDNPSFFLRETRRFPLKTAVLTCSSKLGSRKAWRAMLPAGRCLELLSRRETSTGWKNSRADQSSGVDHVGVPYPF